MYKLVVMGLTAIAIAALLLMVNGYLPYSPFSFLGIIIASVAVAYGSNRLFGWLFGVSPQPESAVITALILALLYAPPTTLIAAVKILLIIVIAMASKYILVWHGRHIFNPAAIGIVIASISGLAYASWWIATPALLPITVIVAMLILYKTQKMTMAAIFLLCAIVVIIARTLLSGEVSPGVLLMTVTSWPLVFVAGVMLSEPLTLPPRRWQQYAVAVLVGLLTALPLHYASITMTPALALVTGNILAWYFGTRQNISLRLVSKKKQGNDGYEFTFDAPKFHFEPGQYVEITVPHHRADFRGVRRVFSLIGIPGSEQVRIATRFPTKHSSYKTALLGLKTGERLNAVRVAGDFVLPKNPKTPLLCIAGGIGITPFLSFAMNADQRNVTILYLPSSPEDLAFASELAHYDVRVVVVYDGSLTLPDDWTHERGRISPEMIAQYRQEAAEVYVSGKPAMVNSVAADARRAGVTTIHTDHFSGY